MVASISGAGLGLFGSTASTLGGNAVLGRGTDRVYVNTTNGNLIVQSQDERLSALGLDLSLVRTYNSQGLLDDDNGDNWRLGVHQRVYGLTGALNTEGSTITKVHGDGREVVYRYVSSLSRYESTEGEGAHDSLNYSGGTWYWNDGDRLSREAYTDTGLLIYTKDTIGNTISYGYNGNLLTEIHDSSGQVTYLDYSGNNLTQIRVVSDGQTQTRTHYTYDGSDRLTQVRVDLSPGDNSIADHDVYTTTYTYDGASRRIASITQTDGSSVAFTYASIDGQYRVQTLTDADGRVTTLSYRETTTTPGASPSAASGWSGVQLLGGTDAHTSKLAFDANGNGIAVWLQGHDLLARRYDKASDRWEAAVVVATGALIDGIGPVQLSVDESGDAIAAWVQNDGASTSVHASRFSAVGNSWSAATQLSNSTTIAANHLEDLSTTIRGSYAAVSWSQGTANVDLFVARWSSGSWSAPMLVESGANPATGPSLAIDLEGRISVAFRQGSDIYVNRYTGAAWSGASLLESAAAATSNPKLAFDGWGNGLVVWAQGNDLLAHRYDAATNTWGTQLVLASGPAAVNALSLSVDASGNAIVAWIQPDGTTNSTYVSRYTLSSNTWSTAALLETSALAVDTDPDSVVTAMRGNQAVVIWGQRTSATGVTALHLSRWTGSAWSAAEIVESAINGSGGLEPSVALDAQGNASVAWSQSDVTSSGVYVNRYKVSTPWSGPVALGQSEGVSSSSTKLAFDAHGNGIGLWLQGADVVARRYDKASNSWSETTVVGSAAGSNGMWLASLSVDEAGNAIAAWIRSDDGAVGSVYVSRYSATSNTWSSAALLEHSTHSVWANNSEDLVTSIRGDYAVVAWPQENASGGIDLNVSWWFGSGWSTPFAVDNSTGIAERPSVALDRFGRISVVWQQDGDIFVNRFDGSMWSGATALENASATAAQPRIAFDEFGNGLALWIQGNNDVIARRYDQATNTWGPETVLDSNAGNISATSLAIDASGNAIAAWVQIEGSAASVFASRYNAQSNSWSAATLLETSALPANEYSGNLSTTIRGDQAAVSWVQRASAATAAWQVHVSRWTGSAWSVAEVADNSINGNSAGEPSVAVDRYGNVSVLWSQSAGTGSITFVNRYHANTPWSGEQLLDSGNASAQMPRVAFDANGDGLAVWIQGRDLLARRYEKATNRWEAVAVVATSDSDYGIWPVQLSVDEAGNAVVAWAQYVGWDSFVYASCYDATNRSWSTATQLSNSTGVYLSSAEELSTSISGGYAAVSWSQYTSDADAYVARWSNGSWSAPMLVESSAGNTTWSSIGIDQQGRISAVWRQGGDIYFNRYDGSSWSGASLMESGSEFAFNPRLVFDRQGNGLAVWLQGDDLLARRYDQATNTWAAQVVVSTGTSLVETLSLSMDPGGDAIVAWVRSDGTANSMYASRFSAASATWSAAALLESSAEAVDSYSANVVTAMRGNQAVVVWLQRKSASDLDPSLHMARWTGSAWGAAEVVESAINTYGGRQPGVAIDAQGNIDVAWTQWDGANGNIYVNRFNVSSQPRTPVDSSSYLHTDVTDASGRVTTYSHDGAGRLVRVLAPAANGKRIETRYTHDADGNVTSITEDPGGLNRVTRMTYDARGNLLSTRDSLGNTVTWTYNLNNKVLSETRYVVPDPDGAGSAQPSEPLTTRYVYDIFNNLRFVISADGRVTVHEYDEAAQLTTTRKYLRALYVDSDSSLSALTNWAVGLDQGEVEQTSYGYDFRGNVSAIHAVKEFSEFSLITQFVYDQRGQLLKTIDPRGWASGSPDLGSTTYTYDGLGRVLSSSTWVSNGSSITTLTSYDDANRRTVTTAANGLITTSLYNRAGQLTSIVNGSAGSLGTTTYTYDAAGRLRFSTDATGVRRFSLYDALDRKVAEVDGDGSLTEYVYDDAHRLIKTIRYAALLNSAAMATLVDGSGNPLDPPLANLRTAAGGNTEQDRISRNVYDDTGRLICRIDEAGAVTRYFYDGAGRVTDEVRYAAQVSIARTVDRVLPDSLTIETAPTDRHTRNFYGRDGHLIGTLDSDGYLVEYVHDIAGNLSVQIAYANRTNAAYWQTGTLDQLRPAQDEETAEDAEQDSRTYFYYDRLGRQIGVFDAEGYLTESQYDAAGLLSMRIRYDARIIGGSSDTTFSELKSHVESAIAEERRYTYFLYDGAGRLTNELDNLGATIDYEYDGIGKLVETTKRQLGSDNERTTATRYDFLGRVLQELTAEGHALITAASTSEDIEDIWSKYGVTYAYDAAGRRISATVRPDETQINVTHYYYDNDNRLRFEVNAVGERKEYRYNALNQLTEEITYQNRISTDGLAGGLLTNNLIATLSAGADAARDAHTTYTYSLTGKVASIITAEGASTTYAYNIFGEREDEISQIDASSSLHTEYTYDKRGQLTLTRWDPTGLNVTEGRAYDAFGRLTRTTDGRNNVTKFEYDRLGRQIATVDPLNARSVTVYDGFSRLVSTTDGSGRTTTYDYDARITRVTTAAGTVTTQRNHHDEVVSVAVGGVIIYTNSYDDNGRLISVSDSLGVREQHSHDRAGREITSTDARGTVTSFTHDAANRVITKKVDSVAGGLGLTTNYTYDGQGRIETVTEANDRVTRTTYDRDGRVTKIAVDPEGLNLRTTYAYDRQGQALLVTEAAGTDEQRRTQYQYDRLGRRIEEIVDPTSLGGTLNLRTQYKYDENGNLTRKIDARGYSTWYVYDANDRVQFTIDALGGVTESSYDGENRLIRTRRYAKPLTSAATLGDVVTLAQVSPTGDSQDRFQQFVYDGAGREVFQIDSMWGVTELRYDGRGNVIGRVSYATPISANFYTTKESVTAQLTSTLQDREQWTVYDMRDRVVYTGATNTNLYAGGSGSAMTEYQYDGAGNVVRTIQYAALWNSGSTTEIEPIQDWLANNTDSARDRTTRYWYDGAGRQVYTLDAEGYFRETRYEDAARRTTTIVYAGKPTIPAGATTADIKNRVNNVVMPTNAAIDQSTITEYDVAGRVVKVTDPLGAFEIYDYDAMGNRTSFINKKGAQWEYEYDANGRMTLERGPPVAVTTVTETGSGITSGLQPTAHGEIRIETEFKYDTLGNVKERIEASNTNYARTTSYDYDELGRQIRTTLPSIGVYNSDADSLTLTGVSVVRTDSTTPLLYTEVSYDALGNAYRSRDVAGNYSYKVYDKQGRVEREMDAEGYVTAYGYDAFGNQTSITRFANRATGAVPTSGDGWINVQTDGARDRTLTKVYDRLNRLYQVVEPAVDVMVAHDSEYRGGATAYASPTTTYLYDAFGQLIRKMTRELSQYGVFYNNDTNYYYDRNGRLTAEIDPMGYLTSYEYDETGDMTRKVEHAKWVESHTDYSFVPRYTTPTSSPNDAAGYDRETTYTYDRMNRLTGEIKSNYEYYEFQGSALVKRLGLHTTAYEYDALGNQTRINVNGASTYHYYDALGRLRATAQPERDRGDGVNLIPLVEFKRDAFGNVTERVEFARGATSANATTFTRDASTGADRITRILYDARGNALHTEDPTGADRFASYTAAGKIAKEWQYVRDNDELVETIVARYTYDKVGNRTAVIEPQKLGSSNVIVSRESDYNAFGEVFRRGANGNWHEYFEYDRAGRLWRTNADNGVDKIYLHDLTGNITAMITSQLEDLATYIINVPQSYGMPTGAQQMTEFVYDLRGQVVERRDPRFSSNGISYTPHVSFWRDRWGAETIYTNQGGTNTTYRYNQLGQVVEIGYRATELLRTTLSTEGTSAGVTLLTAQSYEYNYYDINGRLLATRDGNGNLNSVRYNSAGQITQEVHADGSTKSFVYSAFGEQTQTTDELQYRTRREYDKAGRVVRIAQEVTSGAFGNNDPESATYALTNPNVVTTQYTYDEAGRRKTETNGALMDNGSTAETIKYWYDLRGNVIKRRTPLLHETTYEYDAWGLGKKIRETNALGDYQTWDYTGADGYFGRVTGHRDLGGATYSYDYHDETGLLTTQTSSLGQNITYNYDAAGRVRLVGDIGAPTAAGAGLTNVSRSSEFFYDVLGRLTGEKVTINGVVHQDTTTTYDYRDRISTVTDDRYTTRYRYDDAGNRTEIVATYRDNTGAQRTQRLYYAYDSMNRVRISEGKLSAGIAFAISETQGVELRYNERGDRISSKQYGTVLTHAAGYEEYLDNGIWRNYFDYWSERAGYDTQTYTYDGLARLQQVTRNYNDEYYENYYEPGIPDYHFSTPGTRVVDARRYDGASRMTGQDTWTVGDDLQLAARTTTTVYNDDGRQRTQTTTRDGVNEFAMLYGNADSVETPPATYEADWGGIPYTFEVPGSWTIGFDAAGNLRGYTLIVYKTNTFDPLDVAYQSTYSFEYRKGEAYQEIAEKVASTSSGPQPGETQRTYNVNGELVRFRDTRDESKNRYFANDQQGRAITVVQGHYDGTSGRLTRQQALSNAAANVRDGLADNNKAQHFLFVAGQQVGSVQNTGNGFNANFDVNYTPISDKYPGATAPEVVVQEGDTLRVIAARIYGDADLWYVIAEANGLSDPNEALQTGTALRLPNEVISLSNDASSFKPFDPGEALGNTTPTQPVPPPPRRKGCGILGQILVLVVVVVVTYFSWGSGTGWAASLGQAALGSGTAGTIAGGAIAGAAGSIAGQAVGMATGMQASFDWQGVAMGALGGAVTAGLGATGFGQAAGEALHLEGAALQYGSMALDAAVSRTLTQGLGVLTGLQEKFSWREVAIAAVAAPISSYVGGKVGAAIGGAAQRFVGDVASNVSSAAVRVALGGKIDTASVIVDAFGNALGNSIVDGMAPTPAQELTPHERRMQGGDTYEHQRRLASGEYVPSPVNLPEFTLDLDNNPEFFANLPMPTVEFAVSASRVNRAEDAAARASVAQTWKEDLAELGTSSFERTTAAAFDDMLFGRSHVAGRAGIKGVVPIRQVSTLPNVVSSIDGMPSRGSYQIVANMPVVDGEVGSLPAYYSAYNRVTGATEYVIGQGDLPQFLKSTAAYELQASLDYAPQWRRDVYNAAEAFGRGDIGGYMENLGSSWFNAPKDPALIFEVGMGIAGAGLVGRSAPKSLALYANKFPEHAIDAAKIVPTERLGSISGNFNYVVLENGQLVVGRTGHTSLTGGAPVQAAGEVRLYNGSVKSIDNASGHYQPPPTTGGIAERSFTGLGIDAAGRFVPKVWVPNPSLPRGGSWVTMK